MAVQEVLDRAIAEVRRLPEASIERRRTHVALRIGKKVFGYLLNDHHSDGITGLCCKVLPGESEPLMASDVKRFYRPMHMPKGWVGLRLDVGRVSWREVRELIEGSYRLTAGKRQVALLDVKQRALPK
jgi:predicted DNA-binding protein (MmcQ/YjbR family)